MFLHLILCIDCFADSTEQIRKQVRFHGADAIRTSSKARGRDAVQQFACITELPASQKMAEGLRETPRFYVVA